MNTCVRILSEGFVASLSIIVFGSGLRRNDSLDQA